jgi:hypothetical protein
VHKNPSNKYIREQCLAYVCVGVSVVEELGVLAHVWTSLIGAALRGIIICYTFFVINFLSYLNYT